MATPTRILLIDDGADDRAAIATSLAASNLTFTLVEAADAGAGLAIAQGGDFDCVLLDGRLAGVDPAAYVALLTSAEGRRQAVIALTDEADNAPALLRAGAVDSITRCEATSQILARAIRYAQGRRGFVIELQAAREDAEAKSRALDRLNRQTTLILSIIAHDLRNPFQALLGMSEMLVTETKSGDPEAAVRRAGVLHEAAEQAHGLLESLFAWANLHMDARSEKGPVAVNGLFQDCARAMQERADAKGVRLEAPATDARVLTQEDAAAAILRNLVANALKFTDAGGAVTLSTARSDKKIAICVADTGVGMSEAQVAKLFQLENRRTSAGTDGERGAGLGLLLCRDLADWVGAELEVESRLGHGTTFRLIQEAAG